MGNSRAVKCCIFVFAVLVSSGLVFGADWPNWRGPEHNGISIEKDWNPQALKGGAKVLWEKSIGIGFSSIAVAEGRAYTMGNIKVSDKDTDIVFCFDVNTGKELWKHSYEHPLDAKYYKGGPHATPTVADGKVYTISKRGNIFCLDAKSGKVIWEKKLDIKRPTWGLAGSPVIFGDLVVYNAGEYGVAVKKATGEIAWQNGEGPTGYSTPVPYKAGDVQAAVLFGKNEVFAVDVTSGKKLWSAPWKTRYDVNAADPVIKDDKMFITSGYNAGCALLKIEGDKATRIWGEETETKYMRSQMSGPVLWKGHLYGTNQKELVCLDFETGVTKWSFKGLGNGTVMIAGDKLLALSDKGKLFIAELSTEGFKEISSAQIVKGLCWSPPAFSDGKVFVRTAEGDMVCVDLSK